MPKPCSVCTHRDRDAIDRDVIAGNAITRLAKTYSIPESNLRRHRTHVASVLARSNQARSEDLMQYLLHLRSEAKRLQAAAEEKGDIRTALTAVREQTRLADLMAKIAGEIKPSTTQVLNMSVDQDTARRIATTFLARQKEIPANVQ